MFLSRKIFIKLIIILVIVISSAISSAETITYTYDDLNRLIKVEYGNGTRITYTYDAAGNRLTMNVSAPTPTPTPTAVVTPSPIITPMPSPISTYTPILTPTYTTTPTPVPVPTPSPLPTAIPTPSPKPLPTPEPTLIQTPTPATTPVITPTPKASPSPAVTPGLTKEFVREKIIDIIDTINMLDPEESFKNKNNPKTLANKLEAIIDLIDEDDYEGALNKLENDILKKTDGCNLTDEPDSNDWITDCDAQNDVYPLIVDAIAFLEGLL